MSLIDFLRDFLTVLTTGVFAIERENLPDPVPRNLNLRRLVNESDAMTVMNYLDCSGTLFINSTIIEIS